MTDSSVRQVPTYDQDPLAVFITALAGSTDGTTVGNAICRGLLAPWQPSIAVVRVHRPEIDSLELTAHFGLSDTWAEQFAVIPLSANLPACAAFRRGVETHLTLVEAHHQFPMGDASRRTPSDANDTVVGTEGMVSNLPLRSNGMPIGTAIIAFTTPVTLDWQLRSALDSLVAATSLWARSAWIANDPNQPHPVPRPLVSDRQLRILALVSDGRTNANIATELGFSVATVKAEVATLLRLYSATDRNDLIAKSERSWC
jgi:DNA-binding CsgD family transcriptional regulator